MAAAFCAKQSQRVLSWWPEWPLVHTQVVLCLDANSSSSIQRSALRTGWIESEKLLLYTAESKHAGPPAWSGITETRAVGDQRDFLHAPGLGTVAPQHFLNFLPLRQGQ